MRSRFGLTSRERVATFWPGFWNQLHEEERVAARPLPGPTACDGNNEACAAPGTHGRVGGRCGLSAMPLPVASVTPPLRHSPRSPPTRSSAPLPTRAVWRAAGRYVSLFPMPTAAFGVPGASRDPGAHAIPASCGGRAVRINQGSAYTASRRASTRPSTWRSRVLEHVTRSLQSGSLALMTSMSG